MLALKEGGVVRILKMSLIFLNIFLVTSCATIAHGPNQNIFVSSKPAGVIVKVDDHTVTTPGCIQLHRGCPAYILQFEKEGYGPVTVKLIQTTDGWVWGNILVGGIIGIAIDYSNGSAYELTPEKAEIVLKKADREDLKTIDTDILVYIDKDNLKQKNKKNQDEKLQGKGINLSF